MRLSGDMTIPVATPVVVWSMNFMAAFLISDLKVKKDY